MDCLQEVTPIMPNRKDAAMELCKQAIGQKNATMSKEWEYIFDLYDIHWSELWWLSYWDPSSQLVINTMHCLLEGLVANHVRNLLKLTSVKAVSKPKHTPAFHYNFQTVDTSVSTMAETTQLTPK